MFRDTQPRDVVDGVDLPGVLAVPEDPRARMTCETRLGVVPGATHLFEGPGAPDRVAALARAWFERWLAGGHDAA